MMAEAPVAAERHAENERHVNVAAPRAGVTLKPNDVLIGRGTAYNEWSGNQRFRVLVEERKDPYNSARKNKIKSKLAKEFLDYMKDTVGARFLLLEDSDKNMKDIISEGVWYEVHESVALEKIKQAFRQRSDKKKGTRAKPNAINGSSTNRGVAGLKNDTSRPSSSSPSSSDGEKKPRARGLNVHGGRNQSESNDSSRRKRGATKSVASFTRRPSNGSTASSEAARPSSYAPPIRAGIVSSTTGVASLDVPDPINQSPYTSTFASNVARPVSISSPILPPSIMGASAVDSRPLLFQRDVLGLFQQQRPPSHVAELRTNNPGIVSRGTISAERMAEVIQRDVMEVGIRNMMREQNLEGANEHTDMAALRHIENRLNDNEFQETVKAVEASFQFDTDIEDGLRELLPEASVGGTLSASGPSSALEEDAEDAANALSALSLADFPVITEEQEAEEKATMTVEEKSAALSDLFGQFCSVDSRENKRARRDLDQSSIDFLIRQMRIELEMIPRWKKRALLEAQRSCRSQEEEFGDARLLKFLESQGMNAKLAAERFNNYWEARLSLFGPDNYLLRMTLSEALRNDVNALAQGVFVLLPFPDSSGRSLVFIESARNTRRGYSAESLVRSVWYLMEIMAREHDDFVWILWDKNASIFNYDRFLVSHVPYYYSSCWPIKPMPTHSCCSNAFVRRVVKPVMNATLDKEGRARTLIHDVPENNILEVLAGYGILPEMLPTAMGGTIDLDSWLSSWISQRRAVEMEEIY